MDKLFHLLHIPETFHKPLLLLIFGLCILIVDRIIRKRISRSRMENEIQYRLKKVTSIGSYFLLFLLFLVVYRNSLGGFTVALGVAGAGIAFALQEVIASIAGWLALLFGNFYKTGDRVQLGGITGDVIDIGIIRTTLMETGSWVNGDLYNGRIVRIANSFVFKEPVFNYSGDFPFLWDEIRVPVQFGSDQEMARSLIAEAADEVVSDYSQEAAITWKRMTRKYRIEHAQTSPMITMIFNDNWVEYTLRYVVDYKRRRGTKDRLFQILLQKFSQSGTKVKLASATFEVVGLPEVGVKLKN